MKEPLPLRVTALREKLGRLQGLAENAKEASALAALQRDLATPAQALANLVQQQKTLAEHGVEVKSPASLAQVRKRAAALRDRFRADRNSATLTKGTGWTSLLAEGEMAAKDVESALLLGWKDFRANAYAGDAPTTIEKRIARTPQNLQALADYQKVHAQFSALFQGVPSNGAAVVDARKLAAELVRISGQFDFAVSDEVKRFLAAVQGGGAPLSLLTDEVLKWLADNKAMDGYSIRASGRQ
jgi:hypothetical protein